MQISVLTEYFDQNDFESKPPIKSLINNDIYLTITPNVSMTYYYKVSQNYITLKDSWITNIFHDKSFLKYTDFRFVNIQQGKNEISMELPLISVEFNLDESSFHYTRQV